MDALINGDLQGNTVSFILLSNLWKVELNIYKDAVGLHLQNGVVTWEMSTS
jgi:hypothetical protein